MNMRLVNGWWSGLDKRQVKEYYHFNADHFIAASDPYFIDMQIKLGYKPVSTLGRLFLETVFGSIEVLHVDQETMTILHPGGFEQKLQRIDPVIYRSK